MVKIHPTAIVSDSAIIGTNVSIGPYSIIYDNAFIGENSVIEAYCQIGYPSIISDNDIAPTYIGNNSLIRSNTTIYHSAELGDNLTTGHNVIVRENTHAGCYFQIGTFTEIQGDCEIGNYVRFQSNIFIAKKTIIKDFVWILPNVTITNDPTPPSDNLIGCLIDDYAVICSGSLILPGLTIGKGSVVGALSCVTKNVRDGFCVLGNPAKETKEANKIIKKDLSGLPAYPWTNHFNRGYPGNITMNWNK
ncbi:MAG: N-acetyltransferase [Pelagibacteraceae bacterium]|jgi:acetyltransferase-like isoleucine patch superfamily enzyme|nr:N-acetyltransferase [Pelagibacteraceae bacterium]